LYRKKPVEVEAVQWAGDEPGARAIVEWITTFGAEDEAQFVSVDGLTHSISIRTLEGEMYATAGDWIIRGVKGEFYPCKPDIFEATYDIVDPEERNLPADYWETAQ
jgi:hypothetical protein